MVRTLKTIITASQIGQKWAGIPGIEVTSSGRIFIVWFSGGEKEPMPENTIYLCMSDDGGEIFERSCVMAGPQNGSRAFDPTLWIDPSGRLWLIFNRGNKETAEHGVYARICMEPDAALPVWGEEFRVGYDVPFSFRMNKPTVLSTGEWIMPVTHGSQPTFDWFAWKLQQQGVGISYDQGKNWTLHGAVDTPYFALENMIMERRDGSLVMYIRAGGGIIWQSISKDRGITWSEGNPTTISNPGSRFYIRALPDGKWLLINSPDPEKRTGLVAYLSYDEGNTWRGGLVLDKRDNVSYPDAAFCKDGTILAVYDRDRKGCGEILFTAFTKDDVEAIL